MLVYLLPWFFLNAPLHAELLFRSSTFNTGDSQNFSGPYFRGADGHRYGVHPADAEAICHSFGMDKVLRIDNQIAWYGYFQVARIDDFGNAIGFEESPQIVSWIRCSGFPIDGLN